LTTNDGKVYADYTVVTHDDNGISIWYKDGGEATLPFDNLPADIQKQYGYKPKDIVWNTDYTGSVAQAQADKKLLLLEFCGSDWCGYCQLLEKEVLPTPEFRAFASGRFVCVKVDFPHKTPLPDALRVQNDTLKQKFSPNGFPCLLVVDTNGRELARCTGYNPGSGPAAVIGALKDSLKAGAAAAASN